MQHLESLQQAVWLLYGFCRQFWTPEKPVQSSLCGFLSRRQEWSSFASRAVSVKYFGSDAIFRGCFYANLEHQCSPSTNYAGCSVLKEIIYNIIFLIRWGNDFHETQREKEGEHIAKIEFRQTLAKTAKDDHVERIWDDSDRQGTKLLDPLAPPISLNQLMYN